MLESAVRSDDHKRVIEHEEVIRSMDKDLVSRSCDLGTGGGYRMSGGPFSQYVVLRLQVTEVN